jgi:hypothetical protein
VEPAGSDFACRFGCKSCQFKAKNNESHGSNNTSWVSNTPIYVFARNFFYWTMVYEGCFILWGWDCIPVSVRIQPHILMEMTMSVGE